MKVLIIGEACVESSWARVTHALAGKLSEFAEVAVFGLGYKGEPHPYSYPIYPASYYKPMGEDVIKKALQEFQPDAVLIEHEPATALFYMSHVQELVGRTVVHTMSRGFRYRPNDLVGILAAGTPVPTSFTDKMNMAETAERVLGMTKGEEHLGLPAEYGQLTLPVSKVRWFSDPEQYSVIRMGVNVDVFYPMSERERRQIRKQSSIPEDAFVIGFVGANAPRNRIDAFMDAASAIEDAVLMVHTPMEGAFDLFELADYFGVLKRTYFTHMNGPLSDAGMRALYNTFDVNVDVSTSNTLDLSNLEAAACGVAQIIPVNSGWHGDDAYLTGHALELVENGFSYLPDYHELVGGLEAMRDPEVRRVFGERAHASATREENSWESVAKTLLGTMEGLRYEEAA